MIQNLDETYYVEIILEVEVYVEVVVILVVNGEVVCT